MPPAMGSLVAAVGALWIAVIMWDAFEAIVLPRRVTRRLRPARMFYRMTWRGWSAGPRRLRAGGRRAGLPSLFRPPPLLLRPAPPAPGLLTPVAMGDAGGRPRAEPVGDR